MDSSLSYGQESCKNIYVHDMLSYTVMRTKSYVGTKLGQVRVGFRLGSGRVIHCIRCIDARGRYH
jgi:hypothetical protein